jgi:hypothetical protein
VQKFLVNSVMNPAHKVPETGPDLVPETGKNFRPQALAEQAENFGFRFPEKHKVRFSTV